MTPAGGSFRCGAVEDFRPCPGTHDPQIAALRMAYNVSVSAHADCARALTQALMRDKSTEKLVEAEEEARRKLHAAMARDLGQTPEPPKDKLLR